MSKRARCPSCQEELSIDREAREAGRVQCPACGSSIRIRPVLKTASTGVATHSSEIRTPSTGLVHWRAVAVEEMRLVASATYQQIIRGIVFLQGMWDGRQRRARADSALVSLGKEVFAGDVGAPVVRAELDCVREKIEGLRAEAGDRPSLQLHQLERQQAGLYRRLGEEYVRHRDAAATATEVGSIQRAIEEFERCAAESDVRNVDFLATDSATNVRAAIGIGCLLVVGMMLAGAWRPARTPLQQLQMAYWPGQSSAPSPPAWSKPAAVNSFEQRKAAQQAKRAKISREIARGDELRAAGQQQKAMQVYREAARIDPEAPQSLHAQGAVCMLLKQWDDARELFKRSLRSGGRITGTLVSRGQCNIALGDYRNAVSDFSQAIQEDPTQAEPYTLRAHALRKLSRLDEAMRDVKAALVIDQHSTEAYFQRGWIYSENPETIDSAVADFSKVIDAESKNAMGYYARGCMLLRQEQLKPAMQDLSTAIRLNPDFQLAYHSRAFLAALVGNHQQAVEDFTRVLEAQRSDGDVAQYLMARGESYQALENHALAKADFDRVLRVQPNCVEALEQRAVSLKLMGDTAGAKKDEQRLAQIKQPKIRSSTLFSRSTLPTYYSAGYSDRRNYAYYQQRAEQQAREHARRAMRNFEQQQAGRLAALGVR